MYTYYPDPNNRSHIREEFVNVSCRGEGNRETFPPKNKYFYSSFFIIRQIVLDIQKLLLKNFYREVPQIISEKVTTVVRYLHD